MLNRVFARNLFLNVCLFVIIYSYSLLTLSGCKDKQEQTSSVFGHISDENGNPADNILVTLVGFKFTKQKELSSVYTDKNGNYEITADIPKELPSLDVSIPFFPARNPKFMKYQGFSLILKNDQSTTNCCNATVGERTKYDFKLMSK